MRSWAPRDAEEELAHAALDALRAMTGLTGQIVPPRNVGRDAQFDVAVEVATKRDGFLFYADCKAHVDRQSIVAHMKSIVDPFVKTPKRG